MTRKSLFSAFFALSIVIASGSALANTANQRSYEFFESATSLFNKRDFRGTVIQLRNALQQDPRNLAARVLMGKALLRLGDGPGAERQLWSARNAGADEALIAVPLARALLLQSKHKLLLDEIRIGNRARPVESDVRYLRGQAQLELREMGNAEKSFLSVIRMSPDHGKALLGMARLRHIEGRKKEAEKFVDQALKAMPESADAWYSKGEILRVNGDFASALTHYDKAIEISYGHVPARLSRAATLIDTDKPNEALEDVLHVRRTLPNNPQASYMHAMILTFNGQYEKANEALRDVSNSLEGTDPNEVINDSRSMLLRGVINYSRRRFDDAYPYLARYVELVPQHVGARKMAGSILMRRKDSLSAAKMLEPAVKLAPNDVGLLTLLGNAHMQNKDYEKATELFQKAAKLAPDTVVLKTRLALSHLAVGNREKATSQLDSVVSESSTIGRADIIFGLVELRNGDHASALKIAKRLAKKEPLNPFPHNLAGLAHMQGRKNAEARASFERAIELEPSYGPPQFNLAALDLSEGKTEAAKRRYLDILEQRPNDTRAMMGLSQIAEKANDIEVAIKWLDQIKTIDDDNISARLKLITLYQRVGRNRDALKMAVDLEELNPKNLDVLEAKAQAEVATGQTSKSTRTLRSASYVARDLPARLLSIANRQIKLRDFDGAGTSLKTLISRNPNNLPAQMALVNLEAQSGGTEKALEMADALRSAYPRNPIGDLLVGDMLSELKRYNEAEDAYLAGLKKGNGSLFVIRLYQVRKKLGNTDAALGKLKEWDRKYPGRPAVQRVLASAYMKSGETEKAISAHEAFMRQRPNDPAVLNNLALLYYKKGDPRALDIAERAVSLAPGSPVLLDTYGWILVQKGQAARGLRYLREAQTRASGRLEIRYHIAVALSQLNRADEARRELKEILKSDQSFSDRPAAQALLKDLNRKQSKTR